MRFSFTIVSLFLFALCGVLASPLPAPAVNGTVADSALEERGTNWYTGEGTYFDTGLGACGWVSTIMKTRRHTTTMRRDHYIDIRHCHF